MEVIDPRTLIPLDRETIKASVAKTGRLVVVDEACITCGAAAELTAMVVEDEAIFRHLESSPKRVCGLDIPIPYSPPMEQYALPSRDQIKAAVKEAMA
jgi:pyruvate/2-oxoglutarate/acetoin dehydrogenase E1 component